MITIANQDPANDPLNKVLFSEKACQDWLDFRDSFKDVLRWTPDQMADLRTAFIAYRMKNTARCLSPDSTTPQLTKQK